MPRRRRLGLQRDRGDAGAAGEIEDEELLAAIGQADPDHESSAARLRSDDMRARRQVDRRGVRRQRARGRRLAVDSRDNRDHQDRRAGNEQQAHRDDQDLESAHVSVHFKPMALERVTVESAEAGERLDRVLAARLAALSRTRLKRLVETGQVRLEGATITDPSLRVKPGQSFLIEVPPPADDRPTPQAMALAIAFEDDQVLVLDKPAGLVVHPAPGNLDRTLVNALLAHCGESLAGIGGVRRPGIVHRLDKDTSGLMVIAKTELAHHKLSAAFAAHRMTRAYLALVRGVPSPRDGEIAARIGRSRTNRKKMAVLASGGKTALTRYRTLRSFGTAAALIECRLATGRTHQIRVHLAAKGHPLIGDQVYGRGRASSLPAIARDFPRQALHAARLGFLHPTHGDYLEFSSPLPKDMTDLVTSLESI